MQQRKDLALALVLLALGFAWACNQRLPTVPETPTAPAAVASGTPEGSSSAAASSGSDSYTYNGSGDLTFSPADAGAKRWAGKKSTRVDLCEFGCGTTLILSAGLVAQFDESGAICFGDGQFLPFAGLLTPDRKDPGLVTGQFWFTGSGTAGDKEFDYQLVVPGTVSQGEFPPAPGSFATVDWGVGEMMTEGKGKGKKGGNAGSACVGAVTVSGSLTLAGVS